MVVQGKWNRIRTVGEPCTMDGRMYESIHSIATLLRLLKAAEYNILASIYFSDEDVDLIEYFSALRRPEP